MGCLWPWVRYVHSTKSFIPNPPSISIPLVHPNSSSFILIHSHMIFDRLIHHRRGGCWKPRSIDSNIYHLSLTFVPSECSSLCIIGVSTSYSSRLCVFVFCGHEVE